MLLRDLDEFSACRGGIISIGNFDGVHRGHQLMIHALVHRAQSQNRPAIVLTFDPHPIQLLRPEHAPPELMEIEDRAAALQSLGVDFVVAYPTDQALLNLSPDDFFQQILIDQLQSNGLVEGPNFYFGKNRSGDVDLLRTLCDRAGMFFEVVEPGLCDGRMMSSSEVRNAVQSGNVALAAKILGRLYQIQGTVEHGAERGRLLGFPTANLTEIHTLIPEEGVYSGFGIVNGTRYPAAIHIGGNPTFHLSETKVEVHLIDFSENIYGQKLQVEFLEKLRGIQTFSDAESLKTQLAIDVESSKKQVNQWKAAQ